MKAKKSQAGAIGMPGVPGVKSKMRLPSPRPPVEDEGDNRIAVLFLLVAIIIAGLVLSHVRSRRVVNQKAAVAVDLRNEKQRQQIEASVNRNIQLTNRKIETDKEQIRVQQGFG